jgi:hypothetical protein
MVKISAETPSYVNAWRRFKVQGNNRHGLEARGGCEKKQKGKQKDKR